MGAEPEILLTARGRGRGAGASLETGLFGVAWDSGKWCLVYRLDELMGAELIIDGQVVGAVGVSGVKPEQDGQIAKAGVAAAIG